MNDAGMIRVALCDDHTMVRDALATVLSQEADIDVVGSVAAGADLLGLLDGTVADVVVLDVRLVDESGRAAACRRRAKKRGLPERPAE